MLRPLATLALVGLARAAFADANADARALGEAFAAAWAAGNVEAVVALYANDASVVFPGQGDEAKGRAAIERMVAHAIKESRARRLVLRSIEATPIGDRHIVTVGRWDSSVTGADGRTASSTVRTTEVLVKVDGTWRYLVDHASVGLPPPGPAPRPAPRRHRRER
jgi:uncharacterized protein (TIGR02246 family)